MRLVVAIVALIFLATFNPRRPYPPDPPPAQTKLTFETVPLDTDDPANTRLGALRYLGGWRIRSNDPRFGGISALHVEGRRVVAISDAGSLIRFGLPGAGARSGAEIQDLPLGPGSGEGKSSRDSEAMAVHGRRAWVALETRNVIWRYRRGSWTGEARAAPPEMREWPANRGSEAMVRLRDGRFLIFAEGGKDKGSSELLLFDGDPAVSGARATRLRYRAPRGYRITDAALLPDGRILFLNRRFALLEGFSAKLTVATLPELREGAVLSGTEVATFRLPTTVDNLEALSVTEEGGRTILWIASDDNFTPLQRTLLLKLAFGG